MVEYFCERIILNYQKTRKSLCKKVKTNPLKIAHLLKGGGRIQTAIKKNEDVEAFEHPRFVCLRIRT